MYNIIVVPLCRNVGLFGRARLDGPRGRKSDSVAAAVAVHATPPTTAPSRGGTRAEITFDIGQYRAARARCHFLRRRRRCATLPAVARRPLYIRII